MNKAQEKTQRLRAALAHREADRVPVGESFLDGLPCCAVKRSGARTSTPTPLRPGLHHLLPEHGS